MIDFTHVNRCINKLDNRTECSICLGSLLSASGRKRDVMDATIFRVIVHGTEETSKGYHIFHEACVAPWIESHNTCPNCRKTIAASVAENGATIGKDVTLGCKVEVGVGSRVSDGVTVGDHVVIGDRVFIGNGVKIGDRTVLKTGNVVRDRAIIGSNVVVGEDSVINPRGGTPRFIPVTIEEDALIENNVTLKYGVCVRKKAILREGVTLERGAIVPEDTIVGRGLVVQKESSCSVS